MNKGVSPFSILLVIWKAVESKHTSYTSLHAGSWMVEKNGIRNEVAIMDSRG